MTTLQLRRTPLSTFTSCILSPCQLISPHLAMPLNANQRSMASSMNHPLIAWVENSINITAITQNLVFRKIWERMKARKKNNKNSFTSCRPRWEPRLPAQLRTPGDVIQHNLTQVLYNMAPSTEMSWSTGCSSGLWSLITWSQSRHKEFSKRLNSAFCGQQYHISTGRSVYVSWRLSPVVNLLGKPEVAYFQMSLAVDEQILGLEIAVDDWPGVQVLDGDDDLGGVEKTGRTFEPTSVSKVGEELTATHVLEQHVQETVAMVRPQPARETAVTVTCDKRARHVTGWRHKGKRRHWFW